MTAPHNITMTESRDIYLELLNRAHEADRQPICFTLGPDFEETIKRQLSAISPQMAKLISEQGIETISIEGLPIRRMPSNGIALHTAEISTDIKPAITTNMPTLMTYHAPRICSCGKPQKKRWHLACDVCWALIPTALQDEVYKLFKEERGSPAHVSAVRRCYEIIHKNRKA